MARDRTPSSLEAALADVFEDAHGAASWFTLPGGVRLFAAGDPADTLYMLRSGRLGVYKQEDGGEPHFIGVITPGEPVGEMSLIANTPHTATVVALRDSDIVALPRDAFLAAAAANPALMTELARLMILRARHSAGTVAEPTVFGFISLSARPIAALVSLVDGDRQWSKSCVGLEVNETSRDMAFCANVVHSVEELVVPDTLLDDRFADNPLVVHAPRLRFYAGAPLILDDGECIGTFCIADTRPRDFNESRMATLRDLRDLALEELRRRPA